MGRRRDGAQACEEVSPAHPDPLEMGDTGSAPGGPSAATALRNRPKALPTKNGYNGSRKTECSVMREDHDENYD